MTAEFGGGGAGINAADFDAKRGNFAAQRVGESTRAIFAGGITGDERRGDQPGDRDHVDDVPLAAGQHVRQDHAGDTHGTDQVDLNEQVDIAVVGMFLEPADAPDACIVEEDVDAVVKIECGLDHVIHLVRVDDIHRDGDGFSTGILNFGGETAQTVDAAGGKHNLAAFSGKQPGGVFAKAGGSAGDEYNFIFKRDGEKVHNEVYFITKASEMANQLWLIPKREKSRWLNYIIILLKAVSLMNSPKIISVLLADDHPTTRAGVRAMLSQAEDIQVVGEAENGFEVAGLVNKLKPNVLLLDLVMPGPRPAELEKWVRENYPETITLVLTSHDRDHYLASMMDAGVAGYLNKEATAEQLINAIRRAVQGDILYTNEQYARVRKWEEHIEKKIQQLTTREVEVLHLLANGLGNLEIAKALNISIKTAAYHVSNILSKLQVKSRQEAAIWALTHLFNDQNNFQVKDQ